MRSASYVFIDAHIIRCRLHHNNNLKYSVALKSGKDQQVATDYKPSKDLVIQMDTHLALQADKHSYDNFPKVTLIVSVMNEMGQRKAVGTTFANFRKEGVQIFQVSECSCKDKAFEVEIAFSLRLTELKGSKSSHNKNPLNINKKGNYFSQQPTPRDSREARQERMIKQLKVESRGDGQEKMEKLKKIHSEKVLSAVKQPEKIGKNEERKVEQLIKQIELLNLRIRLQQQQLQQLRCIQQELYACRQKNDFLSQLLQIQEQKNLQAISYINNLEDSMLDFMPKQPPKSTVACTTSFKVIQERDEIIQMNNELQNELQIQRQKNSLLQLEIAQLRHQLNRLMPKQMQKAQKVEDFQQISFINLNKQILEPSIHNNQILITSICKEKKEEDSIILRQRHKLEELTSEVIKMTSMVEQLRIQINRLQALKKQLENSPNKKNPHKASPAKATQVKRQEQPPKSEKGPSKDKNWKPPKITKKTATNPPSSIMPKGKETTEVLAKTSQNLSPTIKIAKLASTEVQSRTEKQWSMSKSSDFQISQKSQGNTKNYNEAVYFTDGFQN